MVLNAPHGTWKTTRPRLWHCHACLQDYHWWWRSYFTSGSSALYLFLYSMFYFYTKLDITKIVPAMMYFGGWPSLPGLQASPSNPPDVVGGALRVRMALVCA